MTVEHYRTLKTTMGRKYRIRMTKEEVRERTLYYTAVVTAPIITLIVFTWAAGLMF